MTIRSAVLVSILVIRLESKLDDDSETSEGQLLIELHGTHEREPSAPSRVGAADKLSFDGGLESPEWEPSHGRKPFAERPFACLANVMNASCKRLL
jgi:hypothetical protein